MKHMHKLLAVLACLVLVSALALSFAGCGNDAAAPETTAVETASAATTAAAEATVSAETTTATEAASTEATSAETNVLGEGNTVFTLSVTDLDGVETSFEIHTDKKTVGEALLDVELIAGEEGQYGLYVTTVNGITLDWDKDGKYWAFYIDGEYATTSLDLTDITPGTTYSLKAE